MGIAGFLVSAFGRHMLIRQTARWRRNNWKSAHTPQLPALPVEWPAIIPVIRFFVLPRHRFMRFNQRTVFNLLSSEVNKQNPSTLIKGAESMGRDQHQAPRHPGTSVSDQITNRPALIIEIKVFHMADFAIRRSKIVFVMLIDAS